MKKILFAALAALAITSCSQNEIDGIDTVSYTHLTLPTNSLV